MKSYMIGLCVLGLACGGGSEGADDGDPQEMTEFGQIEQAETGIPQFYGWDSVSKNLCAGAAGEQCEIPRAKHVQTLGNPQLTGSCNGTIWANSFATARSRINVDEIGTGFTTSDASEPGNLIAARCVSTLPGGAFVRVTPTLQVCSGGPTVYCRMQHATLDVAGDTIINACTTQHTNCDTLERNSWFVGLMLAAGLTKAPPIPSQIGDDHLSSQQKALLTGFVP
jgi:hypothetical protein